MSHPLLNDLSGLTTEELNNKYIELSKKISMAYGFGNSMLMNQLKMILSDYQYELEKRNRKIMEEAEKKNKDFKNIININ